MSRDPSPSPTSRSWRDIPQPVKPRAMSRGGRRRFALSILRWAGGALALAALAAGAWEVAGAWRNPSGTVPGAKAVPLREISLVDPNGVLDRDWLVRTLALPRDATLAALDLPRLRGRVLASGQVADAALYRLYPAALSVHLSERSPVARVMAQAAAGPARAFLVARDGTVYDGVGYAQAMIDSLPWLDGVKLERRGEGFAPLAGFAGEGGASPAELLAQAKLEADHLYRTWRVLSLARLASDGEIRVRTADGLAVTFGTHENFSRQLAKLDWLLDTLRARGAGASAIDLSLAYSGSRQVTVTPAAVAPPAAAYAAVPTFQIAPPPSHSPTREF